MPFLISQVYVYRSFSRKFIFTTYFRRPFLEAKSIDSTRKEVISLLSGLRSAGKSIAGFGAPAKATTLMYHFGITKDIISFIADDNALKQGLFTPGLRIPVVDANHLYVKRPDYLVILAWNFAESIMRKHESYLLSGGRFIVPLPELRVVKTLT